MKQRIVSSIFLVCLFLVLGGCTEENETGRDSNQEINHLEGNNEEDENANGESTEIVNVDESIVEPDALGIPEFTGELDFEYIRETDAQTNLGQYPNEVYTEEGKYYMEYLDFGELLMFHDNATGQDVAVCGKNNCGHNAEGCDAYFIKENYPMPGLFHYNGFLYVPVLEEDYLCLEKISPDGATREKSCKLCRLYVETQIEGDGSTSMITRYPTINVHRGYAYFTDFYPGTQKATMYRVKLDSDEETEVIYSITENNPALIGVDPFGRYVLFMMGRFSEDYADYDGAVYAYDTENDEVFRIGKEVNGGTYTIANNCLYYTEKAKVYGKNLKTGEIKLIYENKEDTSELDISLFGTDEGLVYQLTDWNNDGKKRQILLDYEGEKEPEYIEKQEDLLQPY